MKTQLATIVLITIIPLSALVAFWSYLAQERWMATKPGTHIEFHQHDLFLTRDISIHSNNGDLKEVAEMAMKQLK